MSHRDSGTGPGEKGRLNEETNESEEWQDDRWTIDYGISPDAFIAALHLQPGEEVPDWFEVCPWCSGSTCEECDQTGRIHPNRAVWFEDFLLEAQVEFALFIALLERGRVARARVHVAIVTLGPIMGQFLEEWQKEDPKLRTVLEQIEKSWVRPAS